MTSRSRRVLSRLVARATRALLACAALSLLSRPARADDPSTAAATPAAGEELVRSHAARGDHDGALRAGEVFLARWPQHKRAPFVVDQLGDVLDALAAQRIDGTLGQADAVDRACAMRARLPAHLGGPAWVSPDRLDPAELRELEAIVKRAVRRCAAHRTNLATSLLSRSERTGSAALAHRALGELGLAAYMWTAYLLQDENAPDGAETRYWLADAWHRRVRVEAQLGGQPSPEELGWARSAARSALSVALSARDPATRRTYLQPAAWRLVDLAQLALELSHRRHAETRGREGLAPRALRTTGEGDALRVVVDPLPREVEEAIATRLAYIERVPRELDTMGNAALYTFQVADHYFVYGHFAEAKKLLRKLGPDTCGRLGLGSQAWARLRDIAALENDVPASRELASWRCVEEPRRPRPAVPYLESDAFKHFQRAAAASPGPERDKLWRTAAEAYRRGLEQAPGADAAPEAAISGAYAWQQIGAHTEAVSMYRLFLREYGNEDVLGVLEKGDPRASPPRPADPKQHRERATFLQQASDALASAHVLMFDLGAAAGVYDAAARNRHLEPSARIRDARNAAILHAAMDEPAPAGLRVLAGLSLAASDLAEMDGALALQALRRWDERAPDTGANRAARLAARAEMDRVVTAYEHRAGAETVVVWAAYEAARLRRAGREPGAVWCRKAVRTFERLRAGGQPGADKKLGAGAGTDGGSSALGSPAADFAAECAVAEIDAAIRADLGIGPRRYRGPPAAIARAFAADREKVERHARRLREIQDRFGSKTWTVVARVREASLHDACAAGLDAAGVRAPGRDEAWSAAARGYIEALVRARALGVMPPESIDARRRLSAIARFVGEATVREASRGIVDPATKEPFVYDAKLLTGPAGLAIEAADPLPQPVPARR